MNYSTYPTYQITNPFSEKVSEKINVILFAHNLIGTVRGKSANGLIMHSRIFNTVAIVDRYAVDKKTSKVCQGIDCDIPIFSDLESAINSYSANAVIFLIPPSEEWFSEIKFVITKGLDIINTSFQFIKDIPGIVELSANSSVNIFDLRNLSHQQAYPNVKILERKAKVIYITGTDCGLGKRTAAYELTQEAIRQGINAVMYATGQTGLMLGEKGTVVDALISEFSNGIVSQQVCQFSELGYELIFVEGQSDIFHPANSAVALSILHGANPDGLIIVHDESRTFHKGFDESSDLYKMHPLTRYMNTLELLSMPCGPIYKTIGIATIGQDNIDQISSINELENITVADVRQNDGAKKIVDTIRHFTKI